MSDREIEDIITETLKGASQQNALDFVAYLREREVLIKGSANYWDVHYRGKNVCSIMILDSEEAPGPWTIWSDQEPGTWIAWSDGSDQYEPEECTTDERTKEAAWANVNYCASCGGDCSPGKHKIILGKPFDGLCSSALAFRNPDANALDCAKKMVEMRVNDLRRQITSTT